MNRGELNFSRSIIADNQFLFYLTAVIDEISILPHIIHILTKEEGGKIIDFFLNHLSLNEPLYKMVIYGKFERLPSQYSDDPYVFSLSLSEKISKYVAKNFEDTFFVEIKKNALIKGEEYPINRVNNPGRGNSKLKPAAFISGDWFNRLLNDLVYKLSNRNNALGEAIGNAGMYEGMKASKDIRFFYEIESSKELNYQQASGLIDIEENIVLKKTIFNILKAYGYAELREIKNITSKTKVIGYKIEVFSNLFLYDDNCENRKHLIQISKDKRGFAKRNCFYFRDLLKGMIEALNKDIDGNDFIPDESEFIALEYDILEEGKSLLFPLSEKVIGNMQSIFDMIKTGKLVRVDTCKYLLKQPNSCCIFYIFNREYLFEAEL